MEGTKYTLITSPGYISLFENMLRETRKKYILFFTEYTYLINCRTLLCALFLKHFESLVRAGHIFIAMPPLFRIDVGKKKLLILSGATKGVSEALRERQKAAAHSDSESH